MATTTTNKLYMRFTNESSQDRTWSLNYLDEDLTKSQVQSIATAFITNNTAFKPGYRPTAIVAVWWETVTKDYIINQ